MKQPSRHTQNHHEQTATAQQQSAQQQASLEFSSPEKMIGYDAARTPVPPIVAERLQKSVAQEPSPPPSWWRKLFKKD